MPVVVRLGTGRPFIFLGQVGEARSEVTPGEVRQGSVQGVDWEAARSWARERVGRSVLGRTGKVLRVDTAQLAAGRASVEPASLLHIPVHSEQSPNTSPAGNNMRWFLMFC